MFPVGKKVSKPNENPSLRPKSENSIIMKNQEFENKITLIHNFGD